jgi:MFS transporter, DHA1 family, inner membrane transport protein
VKAKLPLLALALAAFGIGTTEFVIMGLLPEVAADLQVSIPRAGLLISGYAMGVAIGGPLMALATVHLPRKGTLAGLMILFVAGNLACALARDYTQLMVARVVTALCHAAFFGIGAVVAAGLVPVQKRAQAIAMMVSGLTVANVLGVPLGTWLGQSAGWRSAFWGVAALGVVAAAAVMRWLPGQEQEQGHGLKRELRALRSLQVWFALITSVLASTSMFVLFTYIAPILREVSGISPHHVGSVLLLCGLGLTAGNLVGAHLADWRLMPSLAGIFLVVAAILACLALVLSLPIPAIIVLCVWGACSFSAGPVLQTRVLEQAQEGPNLASTLNISAFNLGNAWGAGLGGWALDHGLSYASIPWLAAAPALAAFAVTMVSILQDRRTRQFDFGASQGSVQPG